MRSEAERATVQSRLERGESLRPSHARLQQARLLLIGGGDAVATMSRWERVRLLALSVFLTPIPALLAAWAWRETGRSRGCLAIAGVAAAVDGALWLLAFR